MACSFVLLALLPAVGLSEELRLVASSRPVGPIAASAPRIPATTPARRTESGPGNFAIQQTQAPGRVDDAGGATRPLDDQATIYQIPIEPPGPQKLFRLESEESLMERMRQEALGRTPRERIVFPQEPILSRDTYTGRFWPTMNMKVEPAYVCYNRLLFEQKNFERYGWDLGPATVALSPALFYIDGAMAPYNLFKDPCRHHECNAGYCLPGDPVPLLLYSPGLSLSGSVMEAGAILAILAIFP